MCITLSCTFLCCCCSATTSNCLISRVVEDVNPRQRPSFPFHELWYRLLESNSRQIHQHLTNWRRWNKNDKVWSSVNTLFNWHFHSHHCRCCLSSLMNFENSKLAYWRTITLLGLFRVAIKSQGLRTGYFPRLTWTQPHILSWEIEEKYNQKKALPIAHTRCISS